MLLAAVGTWAQTDIPTAKFNADDLNNATETKRIAIRCTQNSNYNTFYNGNGRGDLPWTANMAFEWEAAGDGTHYIKKAYPVDGDENIYLLNTNIRSFGPKTAENVAKFTALAVSGNISDCGLTTDEDKVYWVRLAVGPNNNTWFNFNASVLGYNNGTGVWTVQHVIDISEYHKITFNVVKDGNTETVTRLAKVGDEVIVPIYDGYSADKKSVTKDNTDTQEETVTYTSHVKTLTSGQYYIYYTDDSDVKHYLQTAGANNVTTVTENPSVYNVSTGYGSTFTHAYKLEMNSLYISNTTQNGNQIQAQATHQQDNDGWLSQVFLQMDGSDKCAIRLTNAAQDNTWHSHFFIGKPSADGAVLGVDPATTDEADYYIWTVEKVEEIHYTLNDIADNSFTGTVTAVAGNLTSVLSKLSGISTCTVGDETWSEDGTSLTATITFPLAVSSETVINKTMIANFNATQRWHAVNDVVKVQTKTATSEDISSWLWAIYPSFENNQLTFTIKNVAENKWVILDESNTAIPSTTPAVTLTESKESASALEVITWLNAPCFKVPGKTLYLSINGNADTDVNLCVYTGGNTSHNGNKVHFPTATYTLTIGAAKAATLYTPIAVTVPTGLKAKYITAEGNEGAVAKQALKYTTLEAGSVIPAGAAVVVVGETDGTSTFTASTAEASELTGNLLFGYPTATPTTTHTGSGSEGTVYALTNNEGTAVFGHYVGANYRAGKAYLDVATLGAGANNVRYFHLFDDNVETGIDNIPGAEQSAANGAVYDLSGRRVNAAQHGIYIIGGKKVIK